MSEDRAWSSNPIIALDGGDPPAEVKVIRGFGYVADLEEKEKSIKVTFMAHGKDGNPREFLPSAWISKSEEQAVKIINASHNKKRNILYRIEIRRQDKIDRKIPIEELTPLAVARKSIFKGLAGVKIRETDDWIFTKAALTNPDEDPRDERFPSALGMEPRNRSKSGSNNDSGDNAVRKYKGVEPPAFVTALDNGDVNPGSIAVASPLGTYSLAAKLSKENNLDFDKAKRGNLAKALLKMSGNLQLAIWDGKMKSPDMGANSFSRARYFIEEVINTDEPVTVDLFDDDNFQQWQKRVESEALKLWRWSIKMVQKTLESTEDNEENDEDSDTEED